jgi:hypothetical protein
MQVPAWAVLDDICSWRLVVIGFGRRGKEMGKIGFELPTQERAIRLSQRAKRFAASIIITNTNEAAQAREFWAS